MAGLLISVSVKDEPNKYLFNNRNIIKERGFPFRVCIPFPFLVFTGKMNVFPSKVSKQLKAASDQCAFPAEAGSLVLLSFPLHCDHRDYVPQ